MPTITIARPDVPRPPAPRIALAPRTGGRGGTLAVIENGKPGARSMLAQVAEGVAELARLDGVEILSKPSAAKPIDADRVRDLAARHRLVLTGVGD